MGSISDHKYGNDGTSVVGFGSKPRDKISLKTTTMTNSSPKTNNNSR